MINKKRILNILKYLFVIIIFYFLGKYILNSVNELKSNEFKINYILLIISFLICLIYLINYSFIWYFITVKNKCNINFIKSVYLRTYSEFGKYIPGKIFSYAIIMYSYKKENQSKKIVIFCMFFEFVASVLASVFIFIISLFFVDIPIYFNYRFTSLIFFLLLFILMHPKILEYISNFILKIIKREPVKFEITYKQVISVVFLYIVNWLIFGFSLMIFVNSIYSIPYQYYFYITGSTAMAGLIGFFAVFVPAGLGVREGILTLALKNIMPSFFAGIISLSSRLWLTLGEITLFLFILVLKKLLDRKQIIL